MIFGGGVGWALFCLLAPFSSLLILPVLEEQTTSVPAFIGFSFKYLKTAAQPLLDSFFFPQANLFQSMRCFFSF